MNHHIIQDEVEYTFNNYYVTWDITEVDRGIHDTVIFVTHSQRDARDLMKTHADAMFGSGTIYHTAQKIEYEELRLYFFGRDQIVRKSLRGYDKRKTIIINRGGL